jgi:Ca2+-binding RTX toxin-like protein
VLTDFGATDNADAVAIGPGGRIVAAGNTGTYPNNDFALARYTSTGTTLPKLSINDVTRFEGNAGLTSFAFTVSLSTASSQTVTVSRQTANGSATAPSDYTALAPATISFAPGETTKTVVVKVKGELAVEPNEGFFVNLSSPTGATIADGQGKGTIQNDDLSASASCTITGTNRSEVLSGTAGNDVICGGRGDDEIYGLDGNDVLKGEDGNDLLVGGNGYDLLIGAGGSDDLRGANGNDTLRGGDQADTLTGGPNSDALFGDIGADTLNTQDGVSANDSADGGSDSDSCTFDSGDFLTSCP